MNTLRFLFSVFLCYFVNMWFVYLSQAAEVALHNGLTMILAAAKVEMIYGPTK